MNNHLCWVWIKQVAIVSIALVGMAFIGLGFARNNTVVIKEKALPTYVELRAFTFPVGDSYLHDTGQYYRPEASPAGICE